MFNLTKNVRRATMDIDFDLVHLSLGKPNIIKLFKDFNDEDIKFIIHEKNIEELNHEDYKGKRANIEIIDNFNNKIATKIDIGVHTDFDILQDEINFDINKSKVSLLVNSKEQIFVEKIIPLLKHGPGTKRYKDLFDLYWLIKTGKLNKDKILFIFEKKVFKNTKNNIYNYEALMYSEINGLKYSDIDHVKRKIYVQRQLGKDLSKADADLKWSTITTQEIVLKTKASKRGLEIPDLVYETIMEQRIIYEKNRSRRLKDKTNPFRDNDYICCSTYGKSRCRNFHHPHYKKLLRDLKLSNIRFHDLRHTFSTLLMKANFNSKAISQLLGHASEIITIDIYTDKSEIIFDCLDDIESFIKEIVPENDDAAIYDFRDINLDIIIDDYSNSLNFT